MSITPVAAPRPLPPAANPPRAARDIADRFTAAVRQGAVPLDFGTLTPQTAAISGPVAAPLPQNTPPMPPEAAPKRRYDAEIPDLSLAAGAAAPIAGMAVVAPPPAAIDPSAFADLMNQLWLREQHKTTREVRVRFGDAAWPATGARLLRQGDGSLAVEVSIGRHAHAGDLDALRRQLAARGIPVASLVATEDA